MEARASVSGLMEATGIDGVYGLAAGEEVTGIGRRVEPRCGVGNLPARGVLVVFSKPATYPGFADPPKPRNRIFIDRVAADPIGLTGPLDQSGHSQAYLSPPSPGRGGRVS